MFRPMRRKQKELSAEDAKQVLRTARWGVLAVNGDDGYPYAIPVNYLYDEAAGRILFHGARSGHKIDALHACDKVCFTVCGEEIAKVKEESWAPFVRSAVVFGRCRLLPQDAEAEALLRKLAAKYYPAQDLVEAEIAASGRAVQMYGIEIEHLSGKEIQEK